MIPGNTLYPAGPVSPYLPPDDVPKSRLVDLELGGVALNDPSQGHMVRVWKAWRDPLDTIVYVEPLDQSTAPVPVVDTGSTAAVDIGLGFDQNMRPVICWALGGFVHLYWYDGTIPGPTVTSWAGRTPVVTLDDKREQSAAEATNDVLLLYLVGADMKMRRQRDRYATEFTVASPGPFASIRRAGMNRGLRLQVEVVGADDE
jgi:hypothetical protein